jgi:hypothetical protein
MIHFAGFGSITGGMAWMLLWICFLLTHGPGPEDRKGKLFHLTSLDYGKFMVLPVLFMAWGLETIHSRQKIESGSVWQMEFGVVMAGYTLMAVTIAVTLWPLPWGANADEVDWQSPLRKYGSILNSLSSLVVALGMILFTIGVVKAKVWPVWIALPLNISSLAAIPWLHATQWGGLTDCHGWSWALSFGGGAARPRKKASLRVRKEGNSAEVNHEAIHAVNTLVATGDGLPVFGSLPLEHRNQFRTRAEGTGHVKRRLAIRVRGRWPDTGISRYGRYQGVGLSQRQGDG